MPVTLIPAVQSPSSVRFGRKANESERSAINQLAQEYFGEKARPVNPKFCYVRRSSIPGLTRLAEGLRDFVLELKGLEYLQKNESLTFHEVIHFRNETMLQTWLQRAIRSADPVCVTVDEEKGLYTLEWNKNSETRITKLSPRQVLYQHYYQRKG